MSKKGQGIGLNVIIIAALALLVLVILVVLVIKQGERVSGTTGRCTAIAGADCIPQEDCTSDMAHYADRDDSCAQGEVCCGFKVTPQDQT